MGNNPLSKNNTNENEEYTTDIGVKVPTDGHDGKFMFLLESAIRDWVDGGWGKKSPDELMTDEEVEYIKNNMEDSENNPEVPTGYLTRVGYGHNLIPLLRKGQLKEGDLVPDEARLRGYSRNPEATLNYMRENLSGTTKPIVIYKTNNNVPHFKVDPFDNDFPEEAESFVSQNTLKIDKITSYRATDYDDYDEGASYQMGNEIYNHIGMDTQSWDKNELQYYPEVIVVDVSPS